jgi:hypothetical protein
MKIKSGTKCYISQKGHNGFWYPIYNEIGMTELIENIDNAETKTWVCGRNELMAVIVPAYKVKSLYGSLDSRVVVWIYKK